MSNVKPQGWRAFQTVGVTTWDRNGEKDHPGEDDSVRCYRCNLPIVETPATLFIFACDGGYTLRKPGAERGPENAILGLHAVGPTCARALKGYAYTMEEWRERDAW